MTTQTSMVESTIRQARAQGRQALSEYEAKQVLAAYGIPVAPEALAQDATGAIEAAGRVGYPVAVKACAPTLLHKSDQGLVALNIGDDNAMKAAVERIGKAVGDTPLDGYLVQRMVCGRREVIVGGMRDALFGPCVMVGLGGILVEALADVAFRLAPLEERDALEMLEELRAKRVFGAVRGEPAADRAAMCQVLIAVGEILLAHDDIAQVDVNPLIINDGQPVAVDALITLQDVAS